MKTFALKLIVALLAVIGLATVNAGEEGLLWQLGGSQPPDPAVKLTGTAEWVATPGYGTGLEFHGNGSIAVVENFPAATVGDSATLTMFFRVNELPKPRDNGDLWEGALLSYGYRWLARVYSNGAVYGGMANHDGELKGIFSEKQVEPNRWHHLALTWSAADHAFTLYLDGERAGFRNDAIAALLPLAGDQLVLGGDPDGGFLFGSVADLRLYNRAFSATEIGKLAAQADREFTAEPNFPGLYSFVTEPISQQPILPWSILPAERMGDTVAFTATPGEYEPASFVLRSVDDRPKVTFVISDLTGSAGTIPASALDLKLIKCWYQGPAAWRNEAPGKAPNVMVPELMLNDYDLVRVDEQTEKNFVRYGRPGAADVRYVDVSDKADNNNFWQEQMSSADHPIYDAETLQPLPLTAGRNQQFFLTLHVPETAAAGNYRGSIRILSSGEEVATLAVSATVLPFPLAVAGTCYDPEKPFMTSVYYNASLFHDKYGITAYYRNADQIRKELANLKAHGVLYPTNIQLNAGEITEPYYEQLFRDHLRLRREAGLPNRPLHLISNHKINLPESLPATEAGLQQLTDRATQVMDIVEEELGHRDVYFYGVDEAKGEVMKAQIPFFRAIQRAGARVFCAGYKAETVPPGNFAVVGDVQDLLICAAESSAEEAAQWHSNGKEIWCYAYPQSSVENPEIYRRNFGLVVYKSNYDGAATFCYYMAFGHPWNDFDSTVQRDMNFVYPTADGVVDTIAFEGYREGFDDIRYATTLQLAIRRALASGDPDRSAIAAEARKFLEQRDVYHENLRETRDRIIDYILKLQ